MRAALLAVAVAVAACAHAPAPPALTRNLDRELLEQATRWPQPTVTTVMQLANQYLATHREADGRAYFCERSLAVPERALFGALCGLFEARTADEVPLLQRVAYVNGALEKLDRAAASDGLSRYLRGIVEVGLPERFGRAAQAKEDLEWMLAHADAFPPGLRRGAVAGLEGRSAPLLSNFSVNGHDGFRFVGKPSIVEVAKGVWVARGYDFGDIAFVATADGLVAIDAGTSPQNARAAREALKALTALPLKTVIVTHAHWDHIGGLGAYVAEGAQVIAQARYAEELAIVNGETRPYRWFFGDATPSGVTLRPDRLIAKDETLELGGVRFELVPARGGETADALLIHLPAAHLVFVGDAFMPYFGAPFAPEGSVEGLLEVIARIAQWGDVQLIHGHAPLTENFPADVLPVLGEALREVHATTHASLREGRSLSDALQVATVPQVLAKEPRAVTPFLLMRDNLVKRIYAQRSGYWHLDGEGMEVFSRREEAALLEEVAGGDPHALVRAAAGLNARGDYAMALRVCELGLTAHANDAELGAARKAALEGLRAQHQFSPFKFIIESERENVAVAPPP